MADHRVRQLLDAAVALVETATGLPAHVQHALTFGADDNELPAYSVMLGAEQPEALNTREIGAVLELRITAYAQGDTEKVTLYSLIDLRRQVHVALMASPTLGLAFVWQTSFGGVEAPETVIAGRVNMKQTALWLVHYAMNVTDPT